MNERRHYELFLNTTGTSPILRQKQAAPEHRIKEKPLQKTLYSVVQENFL